MRGLCSRILVGLIVLGLSLALAAASAASDPASKIQLEILEPSGSEFVFGTVEVVVEVVAEIVAEGEEKTVTEMTLRVDGRVRGRRTAPPWAWQVDVGQENREHRFEIVARGPSGEGRAEVTTPAIQVDDEVDVELQQLYVTVTRGDRRVLDLAEHELRVFDDGEPQELVTFARGDLALAAVLLLDSSESMRGERLQSALRGARAFVDGMKKNDEAMALLFSDQLLRSTPFTQDTEVLRRSLDGVRAHGNTAINDHLYLGLKLLDARQGRRVVVLFTDGADLHSVLDMEDVLWKARRSQALIYWLRLEDHGPANRSFSTAWRDAEGNRRQVELLERVVQQSGGRVSSLERLDQVEPAFRDILAELREQYVLGYYPSEVENDGSLRRVEVRIVGRSGLKARFREGYVDF